MRQMTTCQRADTAPTQTAKSELDAVPHAVPNTHAGTVFHPLWMPSMPFRVRSGGRVSTLRAHCRVQIPICSCCDRGHIYCAWGWTRAA